jgi:hypothetical protein
MRTLLPERLLVAKLEVVDGVLISDRDKEFELNLGTED